jgi:hypothetical protein
MHLYTQALALKELAKIIGCGGHRQIGHIDVPVGSLGNETKDRQVI